MIANFNQVTILQFIKIEKSIFFIKIKYCFVEYVTKLVLTSDDCMLLILNFYHQIKICIF